MTGSRHLRGTVLSRVRNLLRSGAITRKPVWYDVVEAFPPIVETKVNRKPESGRVPKIEYPENFFRRKFYQTYHTNEVLDLHEGKQHTVTDSERFVLKCQELVKEGMEKEEALEEVSLLFNEGELSEKPLTDLPEQGDAANGDDIPTISSIYDLLKDKGITAKTAKRTER